MAGRDWRAASGRSSQSRVSSFLDISRPSSVVEPEGTGEVEAATGSHVEPISSTSIGSAVVNLAHTVMGTGVLALPHAMSQAGLAMGLTFLVIGSLLGAFSMYVLGQASLTVKLPSFTGMGDRVRPGFSVVVELFIIMNCLGSAIGYIIVCSTALQATLGGSRQLWVAVATALATPMTLLRRMDSMRVTSLIGLAVLVAFSIVVLITYFKPADMLSPCGSVHDTSCVGDIDMTGKPLQTISAFCIFTNAFTGQQSLLPILAEVADPSPRKLMLVIGGAMALMMPIYLIFCIPGYLQFGSQVESDILDTYPQSSFWNTFRIAMAFAVLTSYPLQAFATRKAVSSIYRTVRSLCVSPTGDATGPEKPTTKGDKSDGASYCEWATSSLIDDKLEFVVACIVLVLSFGVAMITSSLGVVASITGATGAAGITFVFPGLFYVLFMNTNGWTCIRIGSLCLLIFGFIIMPLSLVAIALGQ